MYKGVRSLGSLRGTPIQKSERCDPCAAEEGRAKEKGVQCAWLGEVNERNLHVFKKPTDTGSGLATHGANDLHLQLGWKEQPTPYAEDLTFAKTISVGKGRRSSYIRL